jgi:hypothetical protein
VVDLPRRAKTVVDLPRRAKTVFDLPTSRRPVVSWGRIDHHLWLGIDGGRYEAPELDVPQAAKINGEYSAIRDPKITDESPLILLAESAWNFGRHIRWPKFHDEAQPGRKS